MKRILIAVLVVAVLLVPRAAVASTPVDVQLPMVEPLPHEQIAETGLTPGGVMLVGFALPAICLGCVIVGGADWTRWQRRRLDRPHRFLEQRRRPSIGQHFATPPLYRRRG